MSSLAILGAGAWGTALGIKLSSRFDVRLWARDAAQVAAIRATRRNERYLPGFLLPDTIVATHHLDAAVDGADAVVIATPVAGLGPTLAELPRRAQPVLWLCKGFVFQGDAPRLPHVVVSESHAGDWGLLSGPSFAQEVAVHAPTALTLASADLGFAKAWASRLRDDTLRIYPTDDVTGVEVGGAVKNVLAIATGICDGLKLGDNARAALITRGLAELARLAERMGGRRDTLMGLSGLGDLVLTCTGALSRNRSVGLLLAAGKSLATIQQELGHVAEGVFAARAVHWLATELSVEMPIGEAVHGVLYEGLAPRAAVSALLRRETTRE
jgi:glycerol-3-phosphate dehydrogenase (NAD(P)+)